MRPGVLAPHRVRFHSIVRLVLADNIPNARCDDILGRLGRGRPDQSAACGLLPALVCKLFKGLGVVWGSKSTIWQTFHAASLWQSK